MKIRQNLHIHSLHSCDSACATINDIQKEMLACGMTEFGLSDHFHTRYNLCDIQSAANDFRSWSRPPEFHFGIEITCVAKWECDAIRTGNYEAIGDDPVYALRFNLPPEGADFSPYLDIDEATLKQCGIEYTIGGVHWPLKTTYTLEEALDDLFRQMMFLAENPLIDILAHPWYPLEVAHNWADSHGFPGHPKSEKSVTDYSVFAKIPDWMNEKLGEALVKNGTCAEINSGDLNSPACPSEYRDIRWRQLAQWREMGVKFTFGTDQHAAHSNRADIAASELLLDLYGFKEDDFAYGFPKKRR
ncbi:MAG: hypothetical protein IKS20_12145 [Victivallales bacterium]|nr:hypothetical protein [Victivallales bacterium]